jgi:hypothetical protein
VGAVTGRPPTRRSQARRLLLDLLRDSLIRVREVRAWPTWRWPGTPPRRAIWEERFEAEYQKHVASEWVDHTLRELRVCFDEARADLVPNGQN